MGISSWRVIPSFLPMLNLELNQIGLSEPVRYSWLGQKSPRPSLEGCGGWVSLFFLRPPGRARKRSELSKGLRALRGWESTPPSRSDFGRDDYARDDGRRPRRRASRLVCVCSHTRVCVHTRSCVCVHTHPLEGPWSGSSSRMLRSLLWRLLPLAVCARAARVWLARDRIFNMVVVLVLPLIILK